MHTLKNKWLPLLWNLLAVVAATVWCESVLFHCGEVWWSRWLCCEWGFGGSALRRADKEIFHVPTGQARSSGYSDAHWIETRMHVVQQNHFPSVRKASAAEEQLWHWGSPSLPQSVMADANPTVTVEQHSTRTASWSPVVTHFPKAMTLQAKTAVLKCLLHAKSGVCDKLHICLLPEVQSRGSENSKSRHLGDPVVVAGRPVGAQGW